MSQTPLLYSSLALIVLGLCVCAFALKRRAAAVRWESLVGDAATKHPAVSLSTRPEPVGSAPAAESPGDDTTRVPPGEMSGPVARIAVRAFGSTHVGMHRDHNEDAFTIVDDAHLFVVADGMGRHAAGEIASKICVDTLRDVFRGDEAVPPRDPPLPWRAAKIRHAILKAHSRVRQAARENESYKGMGTTVVSACFSPHSQRAFIAHVGDSRCYRLRGDQIVQITKDHTLGAAGFKGNQAVYLSRAVGVEDELEVEVDVEIPEPEDVYLLCSDGLTKMIDDDVILATVKKTGNDLTAGVNELISLANENGGRDNITAILVRVDDAPLT
jgi:protein phosphatase